jgi:hypothetical protein
VKVEGHQQNSVAPFGQRGHHQSGVRRSDVGNEIIWFFTQKTFVLLFYGSKVKNRYKNCFTQIWWRGISLLKALHNLKQFVKDCNNEFLVFILLFFFLTYWASYPYFTWLLSMWSSTDSSIQ